MTKDAPEGQTHSYGDGCQPPHQPPSGKGCEVCEGHKLVHAGSCYEAQSGSRQLCPLCSTPKSSPASPVEDKCYCEGSFHCSKCGCDTGCSCSSPQAASGEVVITEELLKDVAREADLDQLALVLFHECRHQPESGKGIKKIRDTFSSLIKETEERMKEAHGTEPGYCCACGYDIAGFEEKLRHENAAARAVQEKYTKPV